MSPFRIAALLIVLWPVAGVSRETEPPTFDELWAARVAFMPERVRNAETRPVSAASEPKRRVPKKRRRFRR